MNLFTAEQMDKLARTAIAPDHLAGKNIRLTPEYESIEQEILKLEALHSVEPVNWELIKAQGLIILSEASKDLLVACYLTLALYETASLSGLSQGFQICSGILTEFWEYAFPEKRRLRGRIQAFQWLKEKLAIAIDGLKITASEQQDLKDCIQHLEHLNELLQVKLEADAPNFLELRKPLRNKLEIFELKQQKTARSTESSRSLATPKSNLKNANSESNSAAILIAEVSNESDLDKAFGHCRQQLVIMLEYVYQQNWRDPRAFRIGRFITGFELVVPDSVASRTYIMPPDEAQLREFQNYYQQQNWEQLFPTIERFLLAAPFWLDGQRMVAEALKALGETECLSHVELGVRTLLSEKPQLLELSFSDGKPFADEQTRDWIQSIVARTGSALTEQSMQALPALNLDSANLAFDWEESLNSAQSLAHEGLFSQALDLFQSGVARSLSCREQSLWRLSQAQFCTDNKLYELAKPLLFQLDKDLVARDIVQWEPQIMERVILLLIECFKQQDDEASQSELQKLKDRLCHFNPAKAFELINRNSRN